MRVVFDVPNKATVRGGFRAGIRRRAAGYYAPWGGLVKGTSARGTNPESLRRRALPPGNAPGGSSLSRHVHTLPFQGTNERSILRMRRSKTNATVPNHDDAEKDDVRREEPGRVQHHHSDPGLRRDHLRRDEGRPAKGDRDPHAGEDFGKGQP